MATKALATKQGPGTALVNWEERLAAMAKQSVATESSVTSGAFISTRAGQLSYNGTPFVGNKVDAVVVDAVLENTYFGSRFDPDNPASPQCYAFGRGEEGEEMVPHDKSPDPQHPTCKGCPQNEFGSADNGKGKACKNIRRLALIPASPLDANALSKSDVAYLKVPVTSVKGWATYVRTLEALQHRPPLGVVTQISCQPHPKDQFHVVFDHKLNLSNDLLSAVGPRYDVIREGIMFPYAEASTSAAPAKSAPKGGKRKF